MLFFDIVVFLDKIAAFLSVLMQSYKVGYKRTSKSNDSKVHIYILGHFFTNFYCIVKM